MDTVAGRPGPFQTRANEGYDTVVRMTGEGAFLADQLSGQFAERNYRGHVSSFSVAAVTVPVNANNLVSVCGIYNPPGSGKILEILETVITPATATTVVQAFVWVSSTVALSAAATFTTLGAARSCRMQDAPASVARVYTAVTHSGTPSVEDVIGGLNKVTSDLPPPIKKHDGMLMIPPGVLASICTLTAASAAASTNLHFKWADVPAS
jgi:hypothetical protein